jgi:hypothetical protein
VHDFGFSWEHEVFFEGCLRVEEGTSYPICLEGERGHDAGGFVFGEFCASWLRFSRKIPSKSLIA